MCGITGLVNVDASPADAAMLGFATQAGAPKADDSRNDNKAERNADKDMDRAVSKEKSEVQ